MTTTRSAAAWFCVAILACLCVYTRNEYQANFRGTFLQIDRRLQEQNMQLKGGGHIVNGEDVPPGMYPWFAQFGTGACGASLISPKALLTAAHCVKRGPPSQVRIGATNQNDGRVVDVRCVNRHPAYDNHVTNDLAVIKLDESVAIPPVALNRNAAIPESSETLTAIGLGRTSTTGPAANILQRISQTYLDPSSCSQTYGGLDPKHHLCAMNENGGSCNGDSGGPLIDSSQRQVGIVSFGSSSGCGNGVPDGYTRVSSYIDWIDSQLENDNCAGFNLWGLFCPPAVNRIEEYIAGAVAYVFGS